MDRDVLPSLLVQDAIKRFIPVRVNAWEELDVVDDYQIPSTPMYAVLDAAGKLVLRTGGYLAAEDFVAFLEAGELAVKTAS